MNRMKQIKERRAGGVLGWSLFLKVWRNLFCRDEDKRSRFANLHMQLIRALIIEKLKKRYLKFALQRKEELDRADGSLPHEDRKVIWGLWWQGLENAPELVKVCHSSIVEKFGDDYEIVFLDRNTYKDYVTLPQDILARFEKGEIGVQLLSDLIRLELLIKYGGTWIDATILCTDGDLPDYMLKDDLFFFQTLFPATWASPVRTENWYLHARSNHKFLILVRDLLYRYLQDKRDICDYLLYYDLTEIAILVYPEIFEKIVPYGNESILSLQDHMLKNFDKRIFDIILENAKLHKLNWRFTEEEMGREGTYYRYLIENFGNSEEEETDV